MSETTTDLNLRHGALYAYLEMGVKGTLPSETRFGWRSDSSMMSYDEWLDSTLSTAPDIASRGVREEAWLSSGNIVPHQMKPSRR